MSPEVFGVAAVPHPPTSKSPRMEELKHPYAAAEAALRSDPASARENALAHAAEAEALGEGALAAYGLFIAGWASLQLGDISLALAELERSQALAIRSGAPAALKIRIKNGIGMALHQRGRYAEADRALDRALAAARRLGDEAVILRCLINYGFVKTEAGRHEDALAFFTEAHEIAVSAGSGSRGLEAAPVTLGNLGLALRRLGRLEESLERLDEASKLARTRGDLIGLAHALCSRGETLLLMDRGDDAEDDLAEALGICLRIGANLAGVRTAAVLAKRNLDQGALDEAEAVIAEWLPRAASGDSLRHAELVRLKGRLLSLRGRWQEAYEASELAGELERRVGLYPATAAALDVDCGRYARKTRRLEERVEGWSEAVTLTLAALIEAKDAPTGRHVDRAAEIARRLGEYLIATHSIPRLDAPLLDAIVRSAPLHDIGKIAVPDSILGKPGPLDPEERELMQHHVIVGKALLLDAAMRVRFEPRVKVAAEIAGYHHERWDGQGYPEGRSGEAIPLPARIVAVADVYDAIRSERPYKPAYAREVAADYIRDNAGRHFDPRIVRAFLDIEADIAALYTP